MSKYIASWSINYGNSYGSITGNNKATLYREVRAIAKGNIPQSSGKAKINRAYCDVALTASKDVIKSVVIRA